MQALFWLSLIGFLYSYAVYPMLLLCLPKRTRQTRPVADSELPLVTLIITARNEAARIRHKLGNALAIDYPRDKLQILIASDCSSDDTDNIVCEFGSHGVRLVRAEERKGKEYAQYLAVQAAAGDIVVFSDVGTDIPDDAIRIVAETFTDHGVGAISSEDRFVSQDGKVAGEGLYVRYEMWLRKLESDVNSLVGLSGSFFAVRRSLCQEWDITVPSDFTCALNSARHGYAAVTEPRMLGYYRDIKDPGREYERKVRTVIRGITAVAALPVVLNPFRLGLFAFQVWSHKIMRWATPWFIIFLLASNVAVAGAGVFYAVSLIGQLAAYGLVVWGWLVPSMRDHSLVKVPYFFVQVNLAMAHAAIAFALGKRITMWTPSAR